MRRSWASRRTTIVGYSPMLELLIKQRSFTQPTSTIRTMPLSAAEVPASRSPNPMSRAK